MKQKTECNINKKREGMYPLPWYCYEIFYKGDENENKNAPSEKSQFNCVQALKMSLISAVDICTLSSDRKSIVFRCWKRENKEQMAEIIGKMHKI